MQFGKEFYSRLCATISDLKVYRGEKVLSFCRKIKNGVYERFKRHYGGLLSVLSRICGIACAKRFDARIRFRRKLNLKNPRSLADKVCYIELFRHCDLRKTCADKYAVREYIRNKNLGEILVPLIGGPWMRAAEVDFDALPDSFVIKAAHGCKMNEIVSDKTNLDINACRARMDGWLDTEYGTYSLEPHYRNIPRRLFAETYLGEAPRDYKFHCLNGVPRFVLVCSERKWNGGSMQVTLDTFDMDWRPVFVMCQSGKERPGSGNIPKPQCFDEMCLIAEKLSEDFDFVRVDLYELNGRVYFGELTFTPACGVFPYYNEKFLLEMGENLVIGARRRDDPCV